MRKIRIFEHTSLDGVIAPPGDSNFANGGWSAPYRMAVYPVLLGRGKRFFSDSADPRELAFVSTKTIPTGVLVNTYRHVGSLEAPQ
jgi:hypothetical protein